MEKNKESMMKSIQMELNFEEFKKTVTNLDNLFFGSMVVASVMFIHWLWLVMGFWLIGAPICYLLICYIGKFLKAEYVKFQERRNAKKAMKAIDAELLMSMGGDGEKA